ncbi:GNAT family N-acetyltransferase [Paraburkholderia sp. MM5384-R2]|uniref:GNAT family N-acetyltransferase n=1 Tax=Paraburkholderia sp. MM5384-R2 TaxID=2723097 RepID=UPI0016105035|nr:GNAT family N-acetyltransferase [Paraburkholderia sp. MM5384-R2]MBB5499049.1 putative GNAT family N-acyltransferase [Paraburkholderia sp. MM5384-R2]
MNRKLSAPQPLLAEHGVASFSCGRLELDDRLKRRALINRNCGASRVFVTTDDTGRVYGYYALAAGAVAHVDATGNLRRNMPDPIPVVVIGRLARDVNTKGIQLGAALLKDALNRASSIVKDLGVRAMLVHAIDAHAAAFYESCGFTPSPIHALTLMLRLA